MKIKELKRRPSIEQNKKLFNTYSQFEKLLNELNKKELPEEVVEYINSGVQQINSASESDKALRKQVKKVQSGVLKLIEKKLKLVTINHYRNMWLAVGMAAFGIPLGVVFGVSIGNMGLLGVGMPIGMVIGMVIGSNLDKQALESGKQLNLEIKN